MGELKFVLSVVSSLYFGSALAAPAEISCTTYDGKYRIFWSEAQSSSQVLGLFEFHKWGDRIRSELRLKSDPDYRPRSARRMNSLRFFLGYMLDYEIGAEYQFYVPSSEVKRSTNPSSEFWIELELRSDHGQDLYRLMCYRYYSQL